MYRLVSKGLAEIFDDEFTSLKTTLKYLVLIPEQLIQR